MKTLFATVDPVLPQAKVMWQAGEILRRGGLVAFPTETVYGLGAHALNDIAVRRVYQVKGRPSDNPLILHANSRGQLEAVADFSAPLAQKLAQAFWPGPLTLVLPRSASTAKPSDTSTVAVRVPAHPVARALIAASGCIIAAPSANASGRPSPTLAAHVAEDLDGAIEMILDGGPASKGLESTVVAVQGEGALQVLRPGALTLEALRAVADATLAESAPDGSAPPSPGMKYRHYAPRAPLILVQGLGEGPLSVPPVYETAKVGILATDQTLRHYPPSAFVLSMGDRHDPEGIAQNLFARLRAFDHTDCEVILAEGIAEAGLGFAVMNRLRKAAAEVITL